MPVTCEWCCASCLQLAKAIKLKICWGCYCCWCWWWASCWQQFVADLKLTFGHKAKLLFRLWAQGLVKILKLKFRQDLQLWIGQFFLLMFCRGYEVESWSRFWSLSFMERLMFGWDFVVDPCRDSEDEIWFLIWVHILARAIWSSGVSLKRSCKMQFQRVGLRSIGPSSQKLWPN